jgi:hypothetical protein
VPFESGVFGGSSSLFGGAEFRFLSASGSVCTPRRDVCLYADCSCQTFSGSEEIGGGTCKGGCGDDSVV